MAPWPTSRTGDPLARRVWLYRTYALLELDVCTLFTSDAQKKDLKPGQ